MCGIIYSSRKDGMPIRHALKKRYQNQKTRGTDGFGFLSIKDGKIKQVGRAREESDIMDILEKEDASHILFHHRLPTSTENIEDATHPIVVNNKLLKHNYYLIHNGVLQNDLDLKKEYQERGFEFTTDIVKKTIIESKSGVISEVRETTFNDSEALAIDLALYLEGHKETIDSVGTIAFICVQTDKKNNVKNIYWGRNVGNPLKMEVNNDLFFLKSEGSEENIEPDKLYTMDFKTGDIVIDDVEIGETYNRVGFNNTNHYNAWGGYSGGGRTEADLFPDDNMSTIDYDKTDYDKDYLNSMISEEYRDTLVGKLAEINREIDSLSEDIMIGEEELQLHEHEMGSEDIIFITETIRESKEKRTNLTMVLDDTRNELEWVKTELTKLGNDEDDEDDTWEEVQQIMSEQNKRETRKQRRKRQRAEAKYQKKQMKLLGARSYL